MRRVTEDRGAVTVIVAVLLSTFLLGLGAIVTDVGSWYAQRAQVQNGADAGALAVAQTCAAGNCDTAAAAKYAPDNSNQTMNTSAVVTSGFPCGNAPQSTTALPACPSGTEDGTYCPKPPADSSVPYVDVHVQTSTAVLPILGQLLDKTDHGKTVIACAQAIWGSPGSLGSGTALTMSACEWDKDTANGLVFGQVPAVNSDGSPNYAYQSSVPTGLPSYLDTLTARRADPDYLDPGTGKNYYVENTITDPHKPPRSYSYGGTAQTARIAGSETVLTTHGFGNNCSESNAGGTAPGQFGWLSNSTCTVTIANNSYGGSPGNSSAPCYDAFNTSRNTGRPVFLPVYDNVTSNGNNTTYTLLGFAAFVVTGWDMTNGSAGNWTVKKAPSLVTVADSSKPNISTQGNYCGKTYTGSNSDVCVYGFFTQALVPPDQLPTPHGPPSLGATAVYLAG